MPRAGAESNSRTSRRTTVECIDGKYLIEPIGECQQRLVICRTRDYIARAEHLFGSVFAPIPVNFNLRGQAAGMYHSQGRKRWIRYNPWIFAKYFEDNLANTVPHEVAHYITDRLHGLGRVRPHGPEWQRVMEAFGVPPLRTTSYDLTGIPLRTSRTFVYKCPCREHELSIRRHNRIRRRRSNYVCRYCGRRLVYTGQESTAAAKSA